MMDDIDEVGGRGWVKGYENECASIGRNVI